MAAKSCKHYYITGRVQGVWFRDSTRKQANLLGVTGWVRNMADGRVEVVVCGSSDVLQAMHVWLQNGPELADVTHVEVEDISCEDFPDFAIR